MRLNLVFNVRLVTGYVYDGTNGGAHMMENLSKGVQDKRTSCELGIPKSVISLGH